MHCNKVLRSHVNIFSIFVTSLLDVNYPHNSKIELRRDEEMQNAIKGLKIILDDAHMDAAIKNNLLGKNKLCRVFLRCH